MPSKVQVASTIALTFLLLVLISPWAYAQCGGLCLYEVGHPLQGQAQNETPKWRHINATYRFPSVS